MSYTFTRMRRYTWSMRISSIRCMNGSSEAFGTWKSDVVGFDAWGRATP
jgi:hypothetical protein